MIRPLAEKDYNIAIDIVNTNWKKTYSDYVNPLLLNEDGCKKRAEELKHDFQSRRLLEYVWEEQGHNIGSQCISFSEQEAKKRGYQEIVIWAFQENTAAISFYQKNGYVVEKSEYLGEPYLTIGTRLTKNLV